MTVLSRILAPSPTAPAFDNSVGLTEREVEIVSRIATGMSNDEIGRSIFVSVNTIKSYIRSAYRKMEVETRSQAVVWAFNHALVAPVLTEAALATQRTATPTRMWLSEQRATS